MADSTSQLTTLIKDWLVAEDEIRVLSAEIREKRKHSKTLKGMITQIMKGSNVGRLNISAGQVNRDIKETRQPLSKKLLIGSLTEFFNGNTDAANKCAAFIESKRAVKQIDTLTLDPHTRVGSSVTS